MPDLIRWTSTAPDNGVGGGGGFRYGRPMADDGEVIELGPPLPDLAAKVTIRFMGPEAGLLNRSKPSSRVEADHAVLVIDRGDGTEERRIELAEVEPYLAEVRAFQAKVAAKKAENLANKRSPEEIAALRAERSAGIRPTCGYCGVPREHRGRRNVATVADPTRLTHTAASVSSLGLEPMELYACPSCGSIELFAVGHLDHPLGG
jgi:hypothetical protein